MSENENQPENQVNEETAAAPASSWTTYCYCSSCIIKCC